MQVTDLLCFVIVVIVAKFIWTNRRLIYLTYKLPLNTFNLSPKNILRFFRGDGKEIFYQIDAALEGLALNQTFFGHMITVNILSPDDVKIIFNSKHCVDKPFFMKDYQHLPKGTLFGHIESWQSHRKILNPYFTMQALRVVIPNFNKKVNILMENVKELDGKGEFNVFHNLSALTLETFLSVMEYEVDIQSKRGNERDGFIKKLEKLAKIITQRIFKVWLHYDPVFKYFSLYEAEKDAFKNCVMALSPSIVANTRKILAEEGNIEDDSRQKTFIRAIVDPRNNLPEDEIHDEIGTLIVAAQDTTALASSASLLLLAMHKDKQEKVLEELRRVFGNSTENVSNIDIEQANELEYMEMVINEAMRLIPVVPILARTNDKEIISSEGHIIPEESHIIIPVFKIHRNKELWGEDANEFRPERFEKEEYRHIHPYAFLPFAKGPRMCVGWRYATYIMKVMLANFLWKYEVDTSIKYDELQFSYYINLHVVQGFKISIKERNNL